MRVRGHPRSETSPVPEKMTFKIRAETAHIKVCEITWVCALRKGTEEGKMEYGKADLLVMEYKSWFYSASFCSQYIISPF